MEYREKTRTYTPQEKREIGRVVSSCMHHCPDIYSIFYLAQERLFPSSRCTYPFKPAMEFLIITGSADSAEALWQQMIHNNSSSLAELFATEIQVNLIIISVQEFVEEYEDTVFISNRMVNGEVLYER